MKNWLSIIIMSLILWLFIFYSIKAFAIPIQGLNLEGPEGLTRKQAIAATNIGNAEFNSVMSRKLRLKSFRSRFVKNFAHPTLKGWTKELGRVNAYIKRHLRRHKDTLFAVYMPLMWSDDGFYYGGLSWKGYYKKFPKDATILVFAREYSDSGKYRIPTIAKVYEHEIGHAICNLNHTGINTGDGKITWLTSCMMTPYFVLEALPIWCPQEIEVCENRFKSWRRKYD